MMYLVTITNNTSGETSAFVTHDKAEAETIAKDLSKISKATGKSLYNAQAPIEITEIEIR